MESKIETNDHLRQIFEIIAERLIKVWVKICVPIGRKTVQ